MKEKNEKVVEETTQETKVDDKVEKLKIKKKSTIKKFSNDPDGVIKVNLDKPVKPEEKENETKEDNADDSGVVAESENAESTEKQEEIQPEAETQETPVLEEITEEATEEEVAEVEEKVDEAIAEAEATGKPIPENIQKLMDFMEETGGDINDYVKLNQDYSKLDDKNLLYEYYRQTKPHLNNEEINFLMEDSFSYDEEVDEEVEEIAEEAEEAIKENLETGKPLPENVQKLMDFMEETGGTLEDYVKINQDYSKLDDNSLLREYYRQTKKHLNEEEINFLMEDQFSYDEEEDEDRDIRRKKLALKEQVANAKSHLDGQKSKYYEEIKAGSKLTQEQQKAVDFFNRYNKESEENQKIAEASKSNFLKKTDQVFNNKFKGFEYNVGDKKYRFNVKDANGVKEAQSDINNFIKKFLNKNNLMEDATGYHKSLYTAMNADTIAKHFYEQGKADAMKDSVAKAKNVDMNPRQSHGEVKTNGMKFKVLSDDNSSNFKFKTNKK